ncbi:unnamed protein product, partial [Chrysoparadoxa australica]
VRKGLSVEEKKAKILEIYHEGKQVYTLKEIEKHAGKAGVVSNTVKDVNQELVNDGLVEMDKVGISNFFWSFPIKTFAKKKLEVERLQEQITALQQTIEEARAKSVKLRAERIEGLTRTSKLQQLRQEQTRKGELEQQAASLKENDPAEIERVAKLTEQCKVAANVWTDNLWALQSWLVKKRGLPPKDV